MCYSPLETFLVSASSAVVVLTSSTRYHAIPPPPLFAECSCLASVFNLSTLLHKPVSLPPKFQSPLTPTPILNTPTHSVYMVTPLSISTPSNFILPYPLHCVTTKLESQASNPHILILLGRIIILQRPTDSCPTLTHTVFFLTTLMMPIIKLSFKY